MRPLWVTLLALVLLVLVVSFLVASCHATVQAAPIQAAAPRQGILATHASRERADVCNTQRACSPGIVRSAALQIAPARLASLRKTIAVYVAKKFIRHRPLALRNARVVVRIKHR